MRRHGGCNTSQFSFECNSTGLRCLVYREDSITKTNKGGLADMKKERKVVWVKPSNNITRCPVRLVEKYMNLLPVGGAKGNFYMQSLRKPKPFTWYSANPVGINSLRKVVGTLLRDAGLDGYFTNHSLRRTCATRLFQAGADVKLVKEITGHVSDAIHKYQTTSDQQRMDLSSVIQNGVRDIKLSQADHMEVMEVSKDVSVDEKFKLPKLKLPISSQESEEGDAKSENVTEIIQNTIKAVGNRRARLTIEVELMD